LAFFWLLVQVLLYRFSFNCVTLEVYIATKMILSRFSHHNEFIQRRRDDKQLGN
jgi:hypothetical protein